jgi:hypothetical protein
MLITLCLCSPTVTGKKLAVSRVEAKARSLIIHLTSPCYGETLPERQDGNEEAFCNNLQIHLEELIFTVFFELLLHNLS